MTRTTAILAAAITAAGLLGIYATAASVTEHSQISQLRTQLAQAHDSQGRAARLITAQQAKLAGEHRDLITCGDLQAMINNGSLASYWQDSNYNLQSTPDSLPQHCVNQ